MVKYVACDPNKEDKVELINFKIVNTAIERILNKELAEYEITYTQATVIGYLKHSANREICQKDIEASLGLTHPTVSSILSRMEKKGMIETKCMRSDNRYKTIYLTPKALEISGDIYNVIERIKQELFSEIQASEQQYLDTIMLKLISNLEKIDN